MDGVPSCLMHLTWGAFNLQLLRKVTWFLQTACSKLWDMGVFILWVCQRRYPISCYVYMNPAVLIEKSLPCIAQRVQFNRVPYGFNASMHCIEDARSSCRWSVILLIYLVYKSWCHPQIYTSKASDRYSRSVTCTYWNPPAVLWNVTRTDVYKTSWATWWSKFNNIYANCLKKIQADEIMRQCFCVGTPC